MKVVYKFVDLVDGNHIYEVGDNYPRDGYKPTKERVEELKGSDNKIGKPLIVAEPDEVIEAEPEEGAEAEPEKVEEKPARSSKRKSDK